LVDAATTATRKMSIKREVKETNGLYFFTFTNLCWLHLFEMTHSYDAVYKWFDYLKMKGHFITGYVIMPNHLHGLVGFSNTSKSINRIIGDGKRFLSYEIVERLHSRKSTAFCSNRPVRFAHQIGDEASYMRSLKILLI